jgi:hypothetical protein
VRYVRANVPVRLQRAQILYYTYWHFLCKVSIPNLPGAIREAPLQLFLHPTFMEAEICQESS